MPVDSERLPTWGEFLYAAKKQGVIIAETNLNLRSPQGVEAPVRFLQRPGEPEVIVPPLALREIVRGNLLANLCRRLKIDPAPFHISLDELPPQVWP